MTGHSKWLHRTAS